MGARGAVERGDRGRLGGARAGAGAGAGGGAAGCPSGVPVGRAPELAGGCGQTGEGSRQETCGRRRAGVRRASPEEAPGKIGGARGPAGAAGPRRLHSRQVVLSPA